MVVLEVLWVSKKTELEKTLDQALSNENWGASGTMLNDIAQASYNEYFLGCGFLIV